MSKLPELVRAMKADKVYVIVTTGFPATLACKVENVPTVVALGAGDPVATNLIDGLARPGGNITAALGQCNDAFYQTPRSDQAGGPEPASGRHAVEQDDLGMSQRYEVSASSARSMGATVTGTRRARAR